MAALLYFRKTAEDAETVTYAFGPDENEPTDAFTITKAARRPTDDTPVVFGATLVLGSILRGHDKLGRWPERGYGAA